MIDGTFVPTDFAGINSNVIEPISASEFTIGYPLGASGMNYYNFGSFGEAPVLDTATAGGFITRINDGVTANFGAYFTMLMAHREAMLGIHLGNRSGLARHNSHDTIVKITFTLIHEMA